MAFTLRPYQMRAIEAVQAAWSAHCPHPLISLPTGCGKTVVFAQIIADHPGRTLVLAHRDELITQAADKIAARVPGVTVGRVIGSTDEWTAPIVVASVQSLHRKRLHRWAPGTFDLIVIDEAHHATSPSYRHILDYLQPRHLLGVTATPFRTDRAALAEVFDSGIVFQLSIQDAIRDGWIADILTYRLRTATDLDPLKTTGGDFVAADLEAAIDTPERNARVVEGYERFAPGSLAIVFAAGVAHAQHIVDAFHAATVPAAVLTGDMPKDTRTALLAAFHTGTVRVLVNVGVLTEGYDEPAVGAVILARPTKSLGFFTQAVGRGLRLAPGKSAMVLIDLADVTTRHRLMTIRHLLGLTDDPPDGTPASTASRREAKALPLAQAFFAQMIPRWSWETVPDLLEEWIDTAPLPDLDWRELADTLEDMRAQPDLAPTPDLWGDPLPPSDTQRSVLQHYGWPDDHLPTTRQEATWVISQHLRNYQQWAAIRARAWASLLQADSSAVEQTMFRKPWDFTLADEQRLKQLARLKLPIPPIPLYAGEVGWVLQYVRYQQNRLPADTL